MVSVATNLSTHPGVHFATVQKIVHIINRLHINIVETILKIPIKTLNWLTRQCLTSVNRSRRASVTRYRKLNLLTSFK